MINKRDHFILKQNFKRKNCKDVYNAFLVKNARYDGIYDFPIINSCNFKPDKLIKFSKCLSSTDYECWIHFYEDDYLFQRFWNSPPKYLNIIKKFKGVILPDFSLYRDMPYVMQLWNIYKSRALGSWLQSNGINVIPNIRFGDERTYDICCNGIMKKSIISIGTYGTYKNVLDRNVLIKGILRIIDNLEPKIIIFYGTIPSQIKNKCIFNNIEMIEFKPNFYIKGV